jgi:hypothetical protein
MKYWIAFGVPPPGRRRPVLVESAFDSRSCGRPAAPSSVPGLRRSARPRLPRASRGLHGAGDAVAVVVAVPMPVSAAAGEAGRGCRY